MSPRRIAVLVAAPAVLILIVAAAVAGLTAHPTHVDLATVSAAAQAGRVSHLFYDGSTLTATTSDGDLAVEGVSSDQVDAIVTLALQSPANPGFTYEAQFPPAPGFRPPAELMLLLFYGAIAVALILLYRFRRRRTAV